MEIELTYENFVSLLETDDQEARDGLFAAAAKTRDRYVGNKVFMRGLIEISNVCHKNCLYCGIRCGNKEAERFTLDDATVVSCAVMAHELGFGSLAIQSGEIRGKAFTRRIADLLQKIHRATNAALGITLSLGEQSYETYRWWKENGAHRYLLRIEASSEDLYRKLHPNDSRHDYKKRLQALQDLRKAGYQVGSGVMIGLPYQSAGHLANDLLFMKEMDLDMAGMGPYIPHRMAPLSISEALIPSAAERVELSLRMIALLRILMKDVNIASTTALETLDPEGRLKGLLAGANVFMPNMTPPDFARRYALYEDKPVKEDYFAGIREFEEKMNDHGLSIGFYQQGNPLHYKERMKNI